MRLLKASLLFVVGCWLGLGGDRASGQGVLIRPNVNQGPAQGPNINPLVINQGGNVGVLVPGAGGAFPNAYGAGLALQQSIFPPPPGIVPPGIAPPGLVAGPLTTVPPFSTIAPPEYFFNYQPYYPFLGPTGTYGNTPVFAGPPIQ